MYNLILLGPVSICSGHLWHVCILGHRSTSSLLEAPIVLWSAANRTLRRSWRVYTVCSGIIPFRFDPTIIVHFHFPLHFRRLPAQPFIQFLPLSRQRVKRLLIPCHNKLHPLPLLQRRSLGSFILCSIRIHICSKSIPTFRSLLIQTLYPFFILLVKQLLALRFTHSNSCKLPLYFMFT